MKITKNQPDFTNLSATLSTKLFTMICALCYQLPRVSKPLTCVELPNTCVGSQDMNHVFCNECVLECRFVLYIFKQKQNESQ